MDIQNVADIIHRIAEGFEDACVKCLHENKDVVIHAIQEQLYSGLSGNDEHLSPTYDNDPFFNEPGWWYHRAYAYKAWKREITPPVAGTMLGLPPRPDDVPNLFIDGTFYEEINARPSGKALVLDPGNGNGPKIVSKYGDNILTMGQTATEYFKIYCLLPSIEAFFKQCGYV